MAQNITLMGASYSDVPAVTLPKTGGGTASFTDVTDTTAAASDVATGKYFYSADGTRTAGTNSGGGGGGLPLIATKSLGTVSTTSTSETNTGLTTVFNSRDDYNDYEMLVVIVSADEEVNNSLIATVGIALLYGDSNAHTKNSVYVPTVKTNYRLNSDGSKMTSIANNTSYGIYAKGSLSGTTLTLTYYTKYNSTRTGTINGNYTARVYGVKLIDLIGG